MKKLIILFIAVMLASITLSGQNSNKARYVYNFAGGITVGGDYATNAWNVKIDSITIQAGRLRIMSGATLQKIAGHVLEADTGDMLNDYISKQKIISATSATSVTGAELIPMVQGGETKSVTVDVFLAGVQAKNTTYYVSNTGSDAADGLTPATAWQTISKVNATTLTAGTSVLFKCNDVWRETLNIPSSGTEDSYITFGSYGEGDKPKILGSTEVTSWTQSHGNVWYSYDADYIDPYSFTYDGNIYFKEINGDISWGNVKKATWGDLAAEYDWAWTLDTLYIYSATDPNDAYSGVEMSQRERGIYLNDKEYLRFDGLEVAYVAFEGFKEKEPYANVSGLIIENCKVHHVGKKTTGYGLSVSHSDMIIRNNEIHDCGRRAVSLNIYTGEIQMQNVIVENNIMYHGFHSTGVDISSGGVGTIDNVIIRNNLFYDDLTEVLDETESYHSHMIFAEEDATGDITNIYIYNNLFKNTTYCAISLLTITSAYIYNNTFYGVNPNQSEDYGSMLYIGATSTATVKNNVFYNNMAVSTINYACMGVSSTSTVISDYNLFYTTDASQRMIAMSGVGAGAWTISQWATYLSASGNDANSPTPADPTFVTGSTLRLQSTSTAINAGVSSLNIPKIDYLGNKRIDRFDIGAYEWQLDY